MITDRSTDQHKQRWLHLGLLLGWIILGIGLRLTQLEAKPPWSDEWATMVFSLGHRFSTVPLNEVISLNTLLLPLRLDTADTGDVVASLMNDSTHPPLYFVLNHWWLKLFTMQSELASVWGARALSALLGAAAIPAMFGLGLLVFRSRLVGQMAAALMAVSPYGIYLSQEARHYTLAILWVMASLGCFVLAARHRKQSASRWLVPTWVGANSLGFATHYFFMLTLAAQFLVLLGQWIQHWRQGLTLRSPSWQTIYAAITGTTIGVLVWLPALQRIPGNNLTSWIYEGNPWEELFGPVSRLLAWLVTMLFLLPIEGTPLPLTILSGLVVLLVLLWLMPKFVWGGKALQHQAPREIQALGGYAIAFLLLVLAMTYFLGADLTAAARFQFNLFPAVVLLLGAVLARLWHGDRTQGIVVIVTLAMGLFGSLTVVSNLGYQKFERPDLVVPQIVASSNPSKSLLIAIAHKSHGQTAELMGLAWQFQQRYSSSPHFLLVQGPNHSTQIEQAIAQLPYPVQVWFVNFADPPQLEHCTAEKTKRVPGYRYQLALCRE